MLDCVRIIAGTFRSRSLQAPAGLSTRPTSDRLRETIFNVLAARIDGAAFLDLYAGSGAVGLEALSRGAAHVTFVEKAPSALTVLRVNLARLGLTSGFNIQSCGVGAFLRRPQTAPAAFRSTPLLWACSAAQRLAAWPPELCSSQSIAARTISPTITAPSSAPACSSRAMPLSVSMRLALSFRARLQGCHPDAKRKDLQLLLLCSIFNLAPDGISAAHEGLVQELL
jgi:hypothetical protein